MFSVLCMQDGDDAAPVDYSHIEPSAESAAAPRRLYILQYYCLFCIQILSINQSFVSDYMDT